MLYENLLEECFWERGMSKKIWLEKEKIVESWSVLIEDGKGKAEDIYNGVSKLIKERDAPALRLERVIVRTGERKSLFGRLLEREYLRVLNEELKDFRIYIGARDYGKDLNVSWYLTCEPGFFKQMLGFSPKGYGVHWSLKMFSQEDLTAYVTLVHHSLLKTVEKLMRDLGEDPSKIDRKSRGFLGVS